MSGVQLTTKIEQNGGEVGTNGGVSSQSSGHENAPSNQLRDHGLSDSLDLVPENIRAKLIS